MLLFLFKGFTGLEGDGYFVTFRENLFVKDMVAVLLFKITSYINHLTEVRGKEKTSNFLDDFIA